MRKVKIPLKQIAGGPQFAEPPVGPESPEDPEELEELVADMEKQFAEQQKGQVSNTVAYAVIGFLLAYLIGSCVWILSGGYWRTH